MRCLRCAGAPRRPARGSGLSRPFRPDMPSSLTPGSSTSHVSSVAMPTRPSPRSERLGTPINPAIRFTRGSSFEASLVRICYGLSGCSPPWTDRTKFPWPTGDFYIQASGGSVALPAAGYDYNSNWTPLLAGLSPAGTAASLAAPDLSEFEQLKGRLQFRGADPTFASTARARAINAQSQCLSQIVLLGVVPLSR